MSKRTDKSQDISEVNCHFGPLSLFGVSVVFMSANKAHTILKRDNNSAFVEVALDVVTAGPLCLMISRGKKRRHAISG